MVKSNPTPLVLIADDQLPTTSMLEHVFGYAGYAVHSVYDGLNALNAANELLPDLILLDVNMPEKNGFEVLKELRDNPATASIPTILITAMGEVPDIVQGLQLGADDYVRKPFYPQELLARAESKMRARKLEETLQRRTQDLEALLRVSEALNQYLDFDELLELILCLVLDLLPGDITGIYRIGESGQVIHSKVMSPHENLDLNVLDGHKIIEFFLNEDKPNVWDSGESSWLGESYPHGIVTPLQYGDQGQISGIVIVAGKVPYDSHHQQLLNGISRQANLALHNAELFEIKANYARDLEIKVEERTKELQSTQRMLVRSEKLASVGRLAASIAHEINNPLMPIKIILDDMLEDIEMGHKVEALAIEKTLESVERIRRVVERLLEFTGKSSRTQEAERLLDINQVIENVYALVKKSFEQEKKSLTLILNDVPPIYGDKDGLEQVLINLVLNASEAMTQGGKVEIKSMVSGDHVMLQVSDTGSGIEPDFIEAIFEPFVSTKEDDSGLGLFVSYGIIQNHKGHIEVQSKVGEGTVFTIHLPIVKKALSNV